MLIIAHRGSSQAAPENTLPAISKAIRDGADAIEIDVQLTKDGQVVVIHDEWLTRTTNGKGFVCNSTYSALENLDAGSWYSSSFKGTKIPLLEEVLGLLNETPIQLHIELKNNLIPYPGMELKVIELVLKYGLEDQVVLSSFRKDSLTICQQLAPYIRRGLLCWAVTKDIYSENGWDELQLFSIHPHKSFLLSKPTFFREIGIQIYPYVIERMRDIDICLHYEVDGLFTNCPARVKQLIQGLD
jgi:glycerophosphoryl diester phosphodiesterase